MMNERGFTLVEMAAALAGASLVILLLSQGIVAIGGQYRLTAAETELKANLAFAAARIAGDLRYCEQVDKSIRAAPLNIRCLLPGNGYTLTNRSPLYYNLKADSLSQVHDYPLRGQVLGRSYVSPLEQLEPVANFVDQLTVALYDGQGLLLSLAQAGRQDTASVAGEPDELRGARVVMVTVSGTAGGRVFSESCCVPLLLPDWQRAY